MLFGFSRGSQEAIRFSLMFPDVTLGVAGLSAGSYTLPNTTYKAAATDPAKMLPYPFGTGDVATICGRAFDPDAARRVSSPTGAAGRAHRVAAASPVTHAPRGVGIEGPPADRRHV